MESSNHPLSESWTMWSHLSRYRDFPGLGLWKRVIGRDLLWARSGIVTPIVLVMITVAWKWGRCRLYIYRSMNVNVHRNGHIYVFVYLSNYVYMYICIRIRICEYIYIYIHAYAHVYIWNITLNTLCVTQTLVNATHTQRRQPDTMNSLENRIARIPNMVYHLFVNKIHTTWRSTWGPPLLDKPKSQMKFVIFLSYVSHSHDVAIEWLVQFPVW
jgi:hypothetical protein